MEEDKNTINVIKFVLAKNEMVKFKQCTKCKRELPCDDLFYNKHPKGRYGYDTKCKECSNIKYKFEIPYNGDSIEQVYSNYRKMSSIQIQKFYNKKSNTISIFLKSNGYNVSKKYIIDSLTKDEVIFMYDSLLNGENKSLTNGILKNNDSFKYLSYILEYVFIEKLKCKTKKDICNILSSSLLKKYSMQGLMATMNLKIIDILNILNKIYNLDIKLWEIKSSSVGNNFWSNKSNIEEVLIWIRNKLKDEYNINNIYESESFGFTKIIEELSLTSLYSVYDGVYVLFEDIFKTKFNPEMCLEKFTFNKNTQLNVCSNDSLIYTISEDYYKLDENGKTLINEVIRFCEKENKFPSEKDLSKKNGYIARTQFSKYFGSFIEIYNYIKPKDEEKPILKQCIECGEIKPFNSEYFSSGKNMRWGLKHICKKCIREDAQRKHYKKFGIVYNKIEDILPEEWWELLIKNNFTCMPKFCYKKQNVINIIKYIVLKIWNCKNRDDIILNFSPNNLKEYKIENIVYAFGGKVKILKECFPEFKFNEDDFKIPINKEGIVFNSFQERDVYDFIKSNTTFEKIKFIGNLKAGKYVFKTRTEECNKFCPDFVIEDLMMNNKNLHLDKPIIIEYYGLYSENPRKDMIVKYANKTKIKEEFYKNNKDIYYIGIFPDDIKNNFEGLAKKLSLFYMENFKEIA